MKNLLATCCVLFGLVVFVPAASAEEPEKLAVVEEMAQAMGFASSHSAGFWEALTQAIAEQRVADEEKAAAERAEQARQVLADAAKHGRRVEQTWGPITLFQEYIPPASGDIVDEQTQVRTGEIVVEPSGRSTVITKYFNGLTQVGVVVSVVEDGVETVTKVIEYEPDSIDVKVGDSRPVPAPGSSSAGKRPHTIDPKADGSLGQASGGTPLEEHIKTATTETVVRRATGDSHTQLEPIELPGGRVITPFIEDRPKEPAPYRSGYELTDQETFGNAAARITAYFDKDGKAVGVVASVIMDGLETIVAVNELKSGALGDLKPGDSRPAPADPKAPSTWDPTPGSGSSPQKEPPAGSSDGGRMKADSVAPDASGGKPASEDAGGGAPAEKSGDSVKWGQSAADDDGNTYTAYEVTHEDGTKETGVKTERADGTSSCKVQTADGGEQDAACPGGMTDEPTCRSSCAHLEVFFALLGCADVECGTPPEGMQPSAGAGPDSCDSGIAVTRVAGTGRTTGSGRSSSSLERFRDCTNADAPGGPADYGDPNDPFAAPPADTPVNPADDGVTDPVNPGEPEELAPESIRLDMHGVLRDPANPPGSEDSTLPGGGPPTTGEEERWAP